MTAAHAPRLKLLGGAGPDCVLIHGFASDSLSWAANVPALLGTVTLHAVDLPAHGTNPSLRMADTLEENGAALFQVLMKSQIPAAHIIGHSLGGAVATALAATYPDAVKSLTLIAPVGLGKGVNQSFLHNLINAQTTEETLAVLQQLFARPQFANILLAKRFLDYLNRDGVRTALQHIGERISTWERAELPDLRRAICAGRRKTAFWGGDDTVNSPCADAFVEAGVELRMIPGAGHMPHVEQSQRINAALISALKLPAENPGSPA